MPLKMRKTGHASAVSENQREYVLLSGGWEIGRIYEDVGGPHRYRWYWCLTSNAPMAKRSGRVGSLKAAKAELQKPWELWKSWAGLEEVD